MAKRSKLPGHFATRFTTTVSTPSPKAVEGDDGRPVKDWYRAGDMMADVTYVGDLERLDGRWTLQIQWVDLENEGHRFAVPHEVVVGIKGAIDQLTKQYNTRLFDGPDVARIKGAIDRLTKQSKSARAKQAAQTRKERGVVPFAAAKEVA